MRKIEIEKRYQIEGGIDLSNLPSPSYTSKITDVYYDTPDGSFYRKGVFIRVRDEHKLDIKFNMDDYMESEMSDRSHTHADEFSFKFPLNNKEYDSLQKTLAFFSLSLPSDTSYADSPKSLLEANNLVELVRVEKERSVYEDEGFVVSLDYIDGLGKFIEVEVLIEVEGKENHKEIEETKNRIDRYVSKFGQNIKANSTGYVELILRQTNFELYKQGKYVLDSDK